MVDPTSNSPPQETSFPSIRSCKLPSKPSAILPRVDTMASSPQTTSSCLGSVWKGITDFFRWLLCCKKEELALSKTDCEELAKELQDFKLEKDEDGEFEQEHVFTTAVMYHKLLTAKTCDEKVLRSLHPKMTSVHKPLLKRIAEKEQITEEGAKNLIKGRPRHPLVVSYFSAIADAIAKGAQLNEKLDLSSYCDDLLTILKSLNDNGCLDAEEVGGLSDLERYSSLGAEDKFPINTYIIFYLEMCRRTNNS